MPNTGIWSDVAVVIVAAFFFLLFLLASGWIVVRVWSRARAASLSPSFLAGQQRVLNAFAVGFAPSASGSLNEPMFTGIEKVRGGRHGTSPDPILFAPDSAADDEVTTTAL